MIIYIGADHRGFALKEHLKTVLKAGIYEVTDVGAPQVTPDDDYVDYAAAVAVKVSAAASDAATDAKGLVICGSGAGVDIVVNKFPRVRSVLTSLPDQAYQACHDDNVNVLSLAADFVDEMTAEKIMKVFLTTPFAHEEKYQRRLDKIAKIEGQQKL